MRTIVGVALFALLALPAWSWAQLHLARDPLPGVVRRIKGQVVDHTHNSGRDLRIWSPALGQKRDLYVYLPPGFDPNRRYPLMLWLHGFGHDEKEILQHLIEPFDTMIVQGQLPPMILAYPDGTLDGEAAYRVGSFYLNTPAGRFQDYLMIDVWDFLHANYPICPGREAHLVAGVSMGGGAAFNVAFKYRDRFMGVLAIFPPLNARWEDCHGRYRGNFDPDCWGWRTSWARRREVIGRFYGLFTFRTGQLLRPLYGKDASDEELLAWITPENPADMLALYDIKPGELEMFIAYGGKDEFNLDAQIESFLYLARQRGLCPVVKYDPRGRHNARAAMSFFDDGVAWIARQFAPFFDPPPCPVERSGGER